MQHLHQFLTMFDACGIEHGSKKLLHRAINVGRLDGYTLNFGATTLYLVKEKDVGALSKTIKRQGSPQLDHLNRLPGGSGELPSDRLPFFFRNLGFQRLGPASSGSIRRMKPKRDTTGS